jgi:sodium/proline symporter
MASELIGSTMDLVIAVILFATYTALLLYLGYDGFKNTNGLTSYAIGSGNLKPWWIGLSFSVTYASANMFIGVPGFAYSTGTPALWWIAVFTGLPFIGLALVAKRFYDFGDLDSNRDVTLPDWLARRFDSPFLRIASGLITLLLAFYVAGQVIGAGTLLERFFGIPYTPGIIVSVALAAVYVASGGMRSTILTDLLQSIVMIIIALVVFFSGVWMFGGIDFIPTVIAQVAEKGGNVGIFSTETNTVLFGGVAQVLSVGWLGLTFILLPHLLNRVLTVDTKAELKQFVLAAGVGLFFTSAFMQWSGLYAYALNPRLEFADAAVPFYINSAFPNIVAIIIAVGLVSAILTTTDSLLQGVGSVIGNDLYKYGVECYLLDNISTEQLDTGDVPQKIEGRSILAARIGVGLVAIVGLLIAFTRPPSLTIVTQIGITGLLSGVTAPLIAGYSWRGCSKRAAEVGFIIGFGSYIVLFVGEIISSFFIVFPISTALSAIGLIITTYVTKQDEHSSGRWQEVYQSSD